MVKHIVTFRFSGTADERKAACRRFADALLALPARIDCLESMEVGINENPSETRDLALTAIVPTMADVEVYAKHPAHWQRLRLSNLRLNREPALTILSD